MTNKKYFLSFSLFLLLNACSPSTTPIQNIEQDTPPPTSSSPANNLPALGDGLPEDIKGFQTWTKLNAQPIPHSDAAPHTPSKGDKNIYSNQSSPPSTFPFSNGTILVKESLHKTDPYVEWVSIMRKIKDLDPEHGDWEFHEYTRNGPDEQFKLAFKDNTCFGCHSSAKDNADWVRYLGDKR